MKFLPFDKLLQLVSNHVDNMRLLIKLYGLNLEAELSLTTLNHKHTIFSTTQICINFVHTKFSN